MRTAHPPLAALFFLLLVGGCVPEDAPEDAGQPGTAFCDQVRAGMESFLDTFPEPEGERYGGTAVVAGLGEISNGLDVFGVSEYVSQQVQARVMLMTLVRYDESFRPAPWLAESWDVDREAGTLTFHLRDDVFWQDGERTDAYDVAFTFERVADPATGFPNLAYWEFYEPEAEVVDSFTVRFRIRPHQEMFDPWRVVGIMPEHLLAEVPPAEVGQHPYARECPVGNGPFRFVEHRPDDRWVFAANPAFPPGLGGRPYLDRLVYRIIPEQTTSLTDLLTGRVDVYLGARPDQVEPMRASGEVRIEPFPFRSFVFVGWNTRRPGLEDPRVRRALTLATNRREIVDGLLEGHGRIINSTVLPFHWAFEPALGDSLPHDPERARALLEEAGWSDRDGDGVRESEVGEALRITVKYNQGNQLRQDVAEILQSQLARVGVEATPQVVEWSTLLESLMNPEARDFDGVVLSWLVDFRHDDSDLFHSRAADANLGWTGLQDPELDRLLDTLKLIPERDEALPVWRRYQERLVELQPFTFLFAQDRLTGVRRRLRNVEMDARGELTNVHEWWIGEEAPGDAGTGG